MNAAKFHKVSAQGLLLPRDATEWEGVYIPSLGIIVSADVLPCGRVPWKKAMAEAAAATLCGRKADGAPSRIEYAHLIDDELYAPALDPVFFRNAGKYSWEWTSTESAPADYAWNVNLDGGDAVRYDQGSDYHVRARCAGQFSELGTVA